MAYIEGHAYLMVEDEKDYSKLDRIFCQDKFVKGMNGIDCVNYRKAVKIQIDENYVPKQVISTFYVNVASTDSKLFDFKSDEIKEYLKDACTASKLKIKKDAKIAYYKGAFVTYPDIRIEKWKRMNLVHGLKYFHAKKSFIIKQQEDC